MAKKSKKKLMVYGNKSKTELIVEKLTCIIAIVLFLASFIPQFELARDILRMISVVFAAYPCVEDVFEGIAKKKFSESMITVVAVCAAMIIGEFPQAAVIAILYRICRWLQGLSTAKALDNINSIVSQISEAAHLIIESGGTESIDTDAIEKGMKLKVLPHEIIPVDCIITEGKTAIESADNKGVPKIFKTGDKLVCGMVNGSSTITVEALTDASESKSKKIIEAARKSASSKSTCEEKITLFMKYFTPAVAVVAVATAVIGSIITGYAGTWIRNAIVIITASFASSVIALIPAPFIASLGAGAKKGIVIKDSQSMEKISKADTFVFDNSQMFASGKLTTGDVFAIPGYSEDDIISLISKYAADTDNDELKKIVGSSSDSETEDKAEIVCGDETVMKENGVDCSSLPASSLYVAVDGKTVGSLQIVNQTNEDAKSLVKSIKELGIKKTILLSTDISDPDKIRPDAGIDKCVSVSADKKSTLAKIKSGDHIVAYLNDSSDFPKNADVKITFGEAADKIPETADINASTSDSLIDAFLLSKRAVNTAKFNIAFLMLVKIAVIILAYLSLAPAYISLLADAVAIIICSVVTLRLTKSKKSIHSK